MLQAYTLRAHACYLLLQDLSKRAEKGNTFYIFDYCKARDYFTGSSTQNPVSITQPNYLQHQNTAPCPTTAYSKPQQQQQGCWGFFLHPLSTALEWGLLNLMEGGVGVPGYITLQPLWWGQWQLRLSSFTAFITRQTELWLIYTGSNDSSYL